ncbi:MAG: esterase [Candidatus Lokiarchaeota archaeon]|nr:esterase [Candidatus Lokiarchaeota archaeon]
MERIKNKYLTFKLESEIVPSPVKYGVILPEDYDESNTNYPLLLFLHGGGGDEKSIGFIEPIIRTLWKENKLPKMVVATPSCTRSLYMNYRDGSENWESFIIEEFLPFLQENYKIAKDSTKTFISGVSAGGLGALRMGFKNVDKFGIILSFEPAIEPVYEWEEIEIRDKFYRPKELFEKIFGKPVDKEYWKENNTACILRENAENIYISGIKIYLEVGTKDFLGLYRGAEFMHRLLFDNRIDHEFRLVYGGDHLGVTLKERFHNGLLALNRFINPPQEVPAVVEVREKSLRDKEEALRRGE